MTTNTITAEHRTLVGDLADITAVLGEQTWAAMDALRAVTPDMGEDAPEVDRALTELHKLRSMLPGPTVEEVIQKVAAMAPARKLDGNTPRAARAREVLMEAAEKLRAI